jgi:hypothetical protein
MQARLISKRSMMALRSTGTTLLAAVVRRFAASRIQRELKSHPDSAAAAMLP